MEVFNQMGWVRSDQMQNEGWIEEWTSIAVKEESNGRELVVFSLPEGQLDLMFQIEEIISKYEAA